MGGEFQVSSGRCQGEEEAGKLYCKTPSHCGIIASEGKRGIAGQILGGRSKDKLLIMGGKLKKY